jgi:hypothetical protein
MKAQKLQLEAVLSACSHLSDSPAPQPAGNVVVDWYEENGPSVYDLLDTIARLLDRAATTRQ